MIDVILFPGKYGQMIIVWLQESGKTDRRLIFFFSENIFIYKINNINILALIFII